MFLRPTSIFSSYTVSHPNTSSSKDISDVKWEGLNPLKSLSSTLENLSTIHVYNLHSKWNHSDCLFYWRGKYKRSEDKIGCLFPHCHDVLWGGWGATGSFSGFSIQEANSTLSIGRQAKLHFPKLFGKSSCPLLKENQIPTNRCSCKQLPISIKHSLKSLIQTTPLPIPVISKQVLRGKGYIYIKKIYLQNHVNGYFQTPILTNQSINGCHY